MRARLAIAAAALAALAANALETAQWPPPEGVAERMKALQETLSSTESTPAQREAAREELAGLLKSPAGQARGRTRDERPARAAIEPFPSITPPAPANPPVVAAPPASGVARLEVVEPPKTYVNPRTGTVTPQVGTFVIDPLTGGVLHQTPNGYIDPRTGRITPR